MARSTSRVTMSVLLLCFKPHPLILRCRTNPRCIHLYDMIFFIWFYFTKTPLTPPVITVWHVIPDDSGFFHRRIRSVQKHILHLFFFHFHPFPSLRGPATTARETPYRRLVFSAWHVYIEMALDHAWHGLLWERTTGHLSRGSS